ncbi:rapid alkalinization factor-like [Canna indica]|uniref:Rapid alkalinization factor-like n=1 Tax=Canna indica TaxID=4628 RepID=A0AAQ3QCM4_9LILI|nr:rapid alkalinization factor-like [Canna indica]
MKKSFILLPLLLVLLQTFLLEKSTGRQGMVDMEIEMEMNSEENRRLLWAATKSKYISYGALRRDVVPCTKPGVPYYNCHSFPTASPYSRGCQIISGCRGGSP